MKKTKMQFTWVSNIPFPVDNIWVDGETELIVSFAQKEWITKTFEQLQKVKEFILTEMLKQRANEDK